MVDENFLDNNSTPSPVPSNPYEAALQSLCKQFLKSKLFRGFYIERRYVEDIEEYRDVICLQKSEKSLEKILCDMRDKLQKFYSQSHPQMWIGITSRTSISIDTSQYALDTCLWVELKDLPFGQYWFSIKSIRFRENEVILKVKEVQIVEEEEICKSIISSKTVHDTSKETPNISPQDGALIINETKKDVTFNDFVLILQHWNVSIKQTIYNFMAHDISKENIKQLLKFFALLLISLLCIMFEGVKFLGTFTIRFMYALSRLTHVLTPIILKIIEMFSKMIGGFYILLAMIWKDAVVNRNHPKYQALEYKRQTRFRK